MKVASSLKNNSGRVLTVIVIVSAILLVSLSAISLFFFQQESEKRKIAEANMELSQKNAARLEDDLKDAKKKIFVLEEKNKEADDKINALLDDIELEKGLREEVKKENFSLKSKLEEEKKTREALQQKIDANSKDLQDKIASLEQQLKAEQKRVQDFQQQAVPVEVKVPQEELPIDPALEAAKAKVNEEIALDKIVVDPAAKPDGRVLSVDAETEFLIINLGEKDGVAIGNILAVYRGDEYLGDIKITRVQPEMSAADFVPPFSSRKVRKNDQVIFKNDVQS